MVQVFRLIGPLAVVVALLISCAGPAPQVGQEEEAGPAPPEELAEAEEKPEAAPVVEKKAVVDTLVLEEIEELKSRVVSFQKEFNRKIQYLSKQDANLGNRIALLNEGIRRLEERVKAPEMVAAPSEADLSSQVAMLSEELKKLEKRLKSIETAPPAPAQPVTPTGVILGFRPAGYDPKASYQAALQDYRDRKYDQALGGFTEILLMSPESDLADNAQYWIGECYYGLDNFQQALAEFQKVFSYPGTEKGDDAQLKIGFCYFKLGDKDQALREFNRLLTDYPDSEYVARAKAKIELLEKK